MRVGQANNLLNKLFHEVHWRPACRGDMHQCTKRLAIAAEVIDFVFSQVIADQLILYGIIAAELIHRRGGSLVQRTTENEEGWVPKHLHSSGRIPAWEIRNCEVVKH